ncbi:hypothetical protein ACUOFC_64870, partial [Escherichia sp. TWPC-MK]
SPSAGGIRTMMSWLLPKFCGFNWGLDFTGGTVIEITLEKPAEIDVMRDALQKAGFEEPMLQNFGSSHDIMVRMPPAEG